MRYSCCKGQTLNSNTFIAVIMLVNESEYAKYASMSLFKVNTWILRSSRH